MTETRGQSQNTQPMGPQASGAGMTAKTICRQNRERV